MVAGSCPAARLLAVSLASLLCRLREVDEVSKRGEERILSLSLVNVVEGTLRKVGALAGHVACVRLPASIAGAVAVAPVVDPVRHLWRRVLGGVGSRI